METNALADMLFKKNTAITRCVLNGYLRRMQNKRREKKNKAIKIRRLNVYHFVTSRPKKKEDI